MSRYPGGYSRGRELPTSERAGESVTMVWACMSILSQSVGAVCGGKSLSAQGQSLQGSRATYGFRPPAIFLLPVRLSHDLAFEYLLFSVDVQLPPVDRAEVEPSDPLHARRSVRHANEHFVWSNPGYFGDDLAFGLGIERPSETEREQRRREAILPRKRGREREVPFEREHADREARVRVAGLYVICGCQKMLLMRAG